MEIFIECLNSIIYVASKGLLMATVGPKIHLAQHLGSLSKGNDIQTSKSPGEGFIMQCDQRAKYFFQYLAIFRKLPEASQAVTSSNILI